MSLFRIGALPDRFDATLAGELSPRYNVAPRQNVAVIRDVRADRIEAHRWGLVPAWADGTQDGFINARAETAAEKPAFRTAYRERRCLVLADGFYEWQPRPRGPKQPYRVQRTDGAPFAMAGLWEPVSDGDTATATGTDETGPAATITVLTCEPNTLMSELHDRMPVVLSPAHERRWLDPDADDSATLTAPREWPDFEAYPVSRAVNDPSTDRPDLIERVPPDEQTGLDEFA